MDMTLPELSLWLNKMRRISVMIRLEMSRDKADGISLVYPSWVEVAHRHHIWLTNFPNAIVEL